MSRWYLVRDKVGAVRRLDGFRVVVQVGGRAFVGGAGAFDKGGTDLGKRVRMG